MSEYKTGSIHSQGTKCPEGRTPRGGGNVRVPHMTGHFGN